MSSAELSARPEDRTGATGGLKWQEPSAEKGKHFGHQAGARLHMIQA